MTKREALLKIHEQLEDFVAHKIEATSLCLRIKNIINKELEPRFLESSISHQTEILSPRTACQWILDLVMELRERNPNVTNCVKDTIDLIERYATDALSDSYKARGPIDSTSNSVDSKMTLDEAINHAETIAVQCNTECSREHKQLADWLKELRGLRHMRIGNSAAMREALSDACYAMFNFLKSKNGGYEEMSNALDKAKSALSEPARNCDIYTTSASAGQAINEHCKNRAEDGSCVYSCPHRYAEGGCAFSWILAPATEKGANA